MSEVGGPEVDGCKPHFGEECLFCSGPYSNSDANVDLAPHKALGCPEVCKQSQGHWLLLLLRASHCKHLSSGRGTLGMFLAHWKGHKQRGQEGPGADRHAPSASQVRKGAHAQVSV